MEKKKEIKKPSLLWVAIGFAVTIYLFIDCIEQIEDMWHLFVLFILWDIGSLASYFGKLNAYKKAQQISAEVQENQVNSVKFTNPAVITVVRKSSILGAIISYHVYVNNEYSGKVKNGKSLEILTFVSHNIVMITDHEGNPFKGEKIIDISEGGRAEIYVKAGRFVK
ncbi:MAG: hypothetical protein LBQ28_00890 [Prevotellaceae bacterium]|jgi:hypothetical protein|nr:hypothetical protein [Prevotellaceae bacterium]